MTTSSTSSELQRNIAEFLPQALSELQKYTEDTEKQRVVGVQLAAALDEPGALTQNKVEGFYKIINSLYSKAFLSSKISDIDSIFTQILYLKKAYTSIENPDSRFQFLIGSSAPYLIRGKKEEAENENLGIFKQYEKDDFDDDSILRERVSYLIDKQNVPPTFIIQTQCYGKGSFQLFYPNIGSLYVRIDELSAFSFSPPHIRSLAFSHMRMANHDPHWQNVLIGEDRQTLKLIDGEDTFPANPDIHMISSFFMKEFRNHLRSPFSETEIALIQKIDIETVCAFLHKHSLDEEAIRTHRCVLLMIKETLSFNQTDQNPINLEDLLVIVYLSDPRGHRVQQGLYFGYCYGKNSLFSQITAVKWSVDAVISDRVRQIFIKLNELKSSITEKTMSVDEKTVQKYYREPSSVLRFNIL